MTSCMVWGVEPVSPLSRNSHGVKTGTIAVWRRKQIPLHTSWRAGSSGTLFFRPGKRDKRKESRHEVEPTLCHAGQKSAEIKRGIATTRHNPSFAVPLTGALLEPAARCGLSPVGFSSATVKPAL